MVKKFHDALYERWCKFEKHFMTLVRACRIKQHSKSVNLRLMHKESVLLRGGIFL